MTGCAARHPGGRPARRRGERRCTPLSGVAARLPGGRVSGERQEEPPELADRNESTHDTAPGERPSETTQACLTNERYDRITEFRVPHCHSHYLPAATLRGTGGRIQAGISSPAKQVRRTFSSSSSSSRRGSTGQSSTGATRLCRNLCVRPFPCIPGNNPRGSNHYDREESICQSRRFSE